MNMIDLYVAEVGRRLPEKSRLDLEKEIRSLIEDAIDGAAEARGGERNEDLIVEVLKKFGPPEKLAASYTKPRYLVGPELYPIYWTVLRIVLAVVLVVSAIGVGLDIGRGGAGQPAVDAILKAIAGLFGALVAAFGNVTLVFALLERLLPEKSWKTEAFDPRKLKTEPDPQRVSLAEPVFETAFTLALLLLLNVYPHLLGLWSFYAGRWEMAPVLAPEFFRYVPYLNILLGAGVVRSALLLQRGRWTPALRWFEVAINLATVAVLGLMLSGPSLLQLNPADLARLGWDAPALERLLGAGPTLATLFRSVLGLALALTLIETGQHLYRIFFLQGRSKLAPSA